ncbi:MAG: hypothetical protein K0S98_2935 [Propionibacteriaceae bacterium]|nr:hypothetical protein [Propionibacteriaceae bacterium]
MLRKLRHLGLTSDMMYAAGFGSIGLSILSWYVSKNKENAGIDRATGGVCLSVSGLLPFSRLGPGCG